MYIYIYNMIDSLIPNAIQMISFKEYLKMCSNLSNLQLPLEISTTTAPAGNHRTFKGLSCPLIVCCNWEKKDGQGTQNPH